MTGKKNTKSTMIICISLAAFAAVVNTGCERRQKAVDIPLPVTDVLDIKSTWGVIRSEYLRVREHPSVSAGSITLLSKGDILEIISKDSHRQEVDGVVDFWYEVLYDGIQGWVFGYYLSFHDSRLDALDAVGELD